MKLHWSSPRTPWLAAAVSLIWCARAEALPTVAGSIVPPYPQGLSENFGGCVGGSHACEYSVGTLSDASGKPLLLRAGRYQGLDESGRARWLITDVLTYPRTSERRVLIASTCIFKGEFDSSVLAVVEDPAEQAKAPSDWAYKVDLTTGKFVKLNPADVACFVAGGDND